MKRWLTLGLLIFAAPLLVAQEGRTWLPEPFVFAPFGLVQPAVLDGGGQESRALVIGDGRTALGIYVYDPLGHCVGFDDEPSEVYDDRIVSWVAAIAGPYDVQIRNFGPLENHAEAAAK
jgi:hypothetical protein